MSASPSKSSFYLDETIVLFQDQNYHALRTGVRAGKLFEDKLFPPPPGDEGRWLRPRAIRKSPSFQANGIHARLPTNEGCVFSEFRAALLCLARQPNHLEPIIPIDNSFDNNYAGIFHFRFWRFGEWIDVVVDDRLPTKSSIGNAKEPVLAYTQLTAAGEFCWALLEKAYAKLRGSYDRMSEITALEVLQDLTGGVTTSLPYNDAQLFEKLLKYSALPALMVAQVPIEPKASSHDAAPQPQLHSYTITGANEVAVDPAVSSRVQVQYVTLQNHFGDENKWLLKQGNCKSYPEWRRIQGGKLKLIGLPEQLSDGEFYLLLDYLQQFSDWIQICETDKCSPNSAWHCKQFSGVWPIQDSKSKDDCAVNEKFEIASDNDDVKSPVPVILSLMQDPADDARLRPISFIIISACVDFTHAKEFATSREISCDLRLIPGHYTAVLKTKAGNDVARYLFRVISKQPRHVDARDHYRFFRYPTTTIVKTFLERADSVTNTITADVLAEILNASLVENFLCKLDGVGADAKASSKTNTFFSSFRKKKKEQAIFDAACCKSMIGMFHSDRQDALDKTMLTTLLSKLTHWTSEFANYSNGKSMSRTEALEFLELESLNISLQSSIDSEARRRLFTSVIQKAENAQKTTATEKNSLDYNAMIMCLAHIENVQKYCQQLPGSDISAWIESIDPDQRSE